MATAASTRTAIDPSTLLRFRAGSVLAPFTLFQRNDVWSHESTGARRREGSRQQGINLCVLEHTCAYKDRFHRFPATSRELAQMVCIAIAFFGRFSMCSGWMARAQRLYSVAQDLAQAQVSPSNETGGKSVTENTHFDPLVPDCGRARHPLVGGARTPQEDLGNDLCGGCSKLTLHTQDKENPRDLLDLMLMARYDAAAWSSWSQCLHHAETQTMARPNRTRMRISR